MCCCSFHVNVGTIRNLCEPALLIKHRMSNESRWQIKIVNTRLAPTLDRAPRSYCLNPGRKWASGARGEPSMVINCLCVCLYLGLSPSRAFSFLIYCSDLLWYVGAISLGCLPSRGSVEFRYLHEARCLSAAKNKKQKKIEMTSSQESSVYPNQDLLSTLSVLW